MLCLLYLRAFIVLLICSRSLLVLNNQLNYQVLLDAIRYTPENDNQLNLRSSPSCEGYCNVQGLKQEMRNSTPVCMFKPRGWGSDGRAGGVCVDEGVY